MRKLSVVSGGFDPLHGGHLDLLRAASDLGDMLCVLVNSDEWLIRKKGYAVLSQDERIAVVRSMGFVNTAGLAQDSDDTVVESLRVLARDNPDYQIVFCNGGDRGATNTPEAHFVESVGGLCVYGVGGTNKVNSSSDAYPRGGRTVQRLWGSYVDHYRSDEMVVKTLYIAEGLGTSYQRHRHRDEIWLVREGKVRVRFGDTDEIHGPGSVLIVPRNMWHSVEARGEFAVVQEVQVGFCREDDIERKEL